MRLLPALVLLLVAGGCGKKESDVPTGPVWTPDAAQFNGLDAEHAVDRFQLRPPRDFKSLPQKLGPNEVAAVTWITRTPDGFGNVFGVGVSNLPDLPLQVHLDVALSKLQLMISDLKKSEPETGNLQGMAFVRTYWNGSNKEGAAIRGFLYVGHDGKQVIEILGAMPENYYETYRQLFEASALTFRKK